MSNTLDVSFTRDFHYLTALIQHLGAHEKWNSRTPRNIADSLGLDLIQVEKILADYPAFFRRSKNLSSQNEPLYALHLRYARRRKNPESGAREAPPVNSSELSMLMDLVTRMIQIEAEDKRLLTESKHNNLKVWAAVIAAVLSSVAAIATALIK
ncbi:hypothetical protein [Vibrio hibernica]